MGNPLVRFWEDQEYDWYMEEIFTVAKAGGKQRKLTSF